MVALAQSRRVAINAIADERIAFEAAQAAARTWFYTSTHISSDIEEPNFFNDGESLGFEIRDLLLHQTAAGSTVPGTAHTVITVGATTTEVSVGTTYFAGWSS